MFFTVGDVMAFLALIVGTAVTTAALMLTGSLLFPARAARAARLIEEAPKRVIGVGLVSFAPLLLLGIVILSVPAPPVKFIGTVFLLGLLMACGVGGSGLVRLVGCRLRMMNPSISQAWSESMASLLVTGSCLLPLLGWFLVTPLVLCATFGSYVLTLRRERPAVGQSAPAEAQ